MQSLMKRHRLWPPLILLLLCLLAAGYAQLELAPLSGRFQYLWPAPAPTEIATGGADDGASADVQAAAPTGGAAQNTGLRTARDGMDSIRTAVDGACENVALSAVKGSATVTSDDENNPQTTAARLEAIEQAGYGVKDFDLYTGRLIYPDEFERGLHVAMIDEQLAVALFKYAEPLGRDVLINETKYRIVAIVRDSKRVGDQQEYTLYVPYRAIEQDSLVMDALCIDAEPIAGAGGWSAFESATQSVSTAGTCVSLTKESMNAALPLRVLLCVFGFMAVFFGLRVLSTRSLGTYYRYRVRLRDEYALRLLPWLIGRGLVLAVGYAVCAGLLALVFVQLINPVYTFPEWIPSVLVEPTEITKAFWNVWQGQASLMELRSPELLRIRFFRSLMGWSCGGAAIFGGLLIGRCGALLRKWTRKPVNPHAEISDPNVESAE